MDKATRVISGTWGEMWLEGEKVAECYKLQAKRTFNKEKVPMCGQMEVDTKILNIEGTGSVGLYKVSSRMSVLIGEAAAQGHDPRFTIISKLADPDAYGAERIALYNCSFDDETVADWEAGVIGKVECPFTFTKRELLNTIAAR